MAEREQADPVEEGERRRVQAPEVSWALRETTRAAAEVDHALTTAMQLRPMDYSALGHVMGARVPLGPAELAGRLGISTGSATELVDRLERAGHLRRERHSSDRRRLSLHATDSATTEVLTMLGPLFGELDALAEALTPSEREVVTSYLRAVAARMWAFAAERLEADPSGPG